MDKPDREGLWAVRSDLSNEWLPVIVTRNGNGLVVNRLTHRPEPLNEFCAELKTPEWKQLLPSGMF